MSSKLLEPTPFRTAHSFDTASFVDGDSFRCKEHEIVKLIYFYLPVIRQTILVMGKES